MATLGPDLGEEGEGQRLGCWPPLGGNSWGRQCWSRADDYWGRRPAAVVGWEKT
jgi:hypothetical protein